MRTFTTCLAILFIAACGGGGGGGSSPVPIAGVSAATGSSQSALNWSLDRSAAEDNDVIAVLDLIFADEAVQSAMLVKDGIIIGERYADGTTADTLGTSWSIAKSFYGAAIGVAIEEGWIVSLDQRASDFITEWVDTPKEDITIRQLLAMRSGYPADSRVFREADHTAYALGLDLDSVPGSTFVYSNASSQLFEPILQRATGLDAHSYLSEKILKPIGIDVNRIGLWRDSAGNPITHSGLDLRPEDLIRFGLMYTRNGAWNGGQIVPRQFVAESISAKSDYYGLQWWLLNEAFFRKAVPITLVAGLGIDGQKLYIWPEQDIVLAVMTKYEHSRNQGYTQGPDNFPDTCSARNSCSGTSSWVPFFNELNLVFLIEALAR